MSVLLRCAGRLSLAAWLAMGANGALAQPAGAQGEDFLYRVVQGDTLGEISQRYTGNTENWRRLQQLNQVSDQYSLPIAMLLRIPFSLIPVRDSAARISHLLGDVRIDGRAVRMGQSLNEGQALTTGLNGFATLELADGSVLSVPFSSEFRLDRLREFQGTGLIDLIVDMRQGSMESEVAPQQTGVGRFEVRTPVSVTGVRGTRLRVHNSGEGSRSEVLRGQANVDASQTDTMLRAQQGVAVDAAGRSSGVQRLLDAPQLSTPVRGGSGWVVDFPAVAGAQQYVVLVSTDEQGTQLVSRRTEAAPPVTVSAHAPGQHYAIVRAVDAAGLEGLDARQPFDGQAVLMSGDGGMVASNWAGPVLLSDY
ncbi:FecR domain-containing protein [Pusillimonas sp. CC-YST705]|uniref:FecR domain-containing protein n=1 Tax=Mesopusillimonas faecipullorum TaxID=2755040 RepID=A0ABS8C8C7_9BURK|nr:FecR domain-containing protein [Mesopusillimonas faecipullorum]MCB5362281.1 FecR domain-containing protein [Mesopusillimonas faecipullorum]